jgi:hypothetical protein
MDGVRAVTDAEVAFYQENGWALLPSLVAPGVVEDLRRRAGALAEADPENEVLDGVAERDASFRALTFSPTMARNAARLLPGSPPVRLQVDNLLVVPPAAADGEGSAAFHQDFPWMPMDRSGMVNLWLALVEVPAVMGPLRFYSGSHRHGILGRSFVREGDDALSQHPWVGELESSPPFDLAAGDATVHSALVVHAAPGNRHTSRRLSYAVTYFDAGALYTGAPFPQTDGLGLRVNEPFDHPRFPLLPQG